jgi:hypothetical protein
LVSLIEGLARSAPASTIEVVTKTPLNDEPPTHPPTERLFAPAIAGAESESASESVAFKPVGEVGESHPELEPELAEPAATPSVLLESFPVEPEVTADQSSSARTAVASPPEDPPPIQGGAPRVAVRDLALEVASKILRLHVREGPDLTALESCREQAQVLVAALTCKADADLDPRAIALAGGEHPLARLVTVVEGTEYLDDAGWAELRASIADAFGPHLASAAARSRLMILPESTV